jgi:phospholipid transport system transporter-binding protein
MEIQPPSPSSLRLPADCSIASIREIHGLIRQSLASQGHLEIDCSAVDKADVTSVQLLISATRTACEQGTSLNLTALSQCLESTFERAGVAAGVIGETASPTSNEVK